MGALAPTYCNIAKIYLQPKILRCEIAAQTQPSLVWWLQQLSVATQGMLMQHNNGVTLFPTKCNENPKNGCIGVNLLQHKK
jgi:hypothetical protein